MATEGELAAALGRILNGSGGVSDVRNVAALERLLEQEQREKGRLLLLTVLAQSSDDVRAVLAHGRGISVLDGWLQQGQQAPGQEALMLQVVRCLADTFPMDIDTLKRTGIGRTVGQLRWGRWGDEDGHPWGWEVEARWEAGVAAGFG
jgi:hypothetical protein